MKKMLYTAAILTSLFSLAQEGVWTSTVSEVIEYETNKIEDNYWDGPYDVERIQVEIASNVTTVTSTRD